MFVDLVGIVFQNESKLSDTTKRARLRFLSFELTKGMRHRLELIR